MTSSSCSIFFKILVVDKSTYGASAFNAVTITTTKGTTKKEYENVREIVGKAISKMRANFPTRPHSYIGYYRDYQLLQSKYFNLNEGIIEVFDS